MVVFMDQLSVQTPPMKDNVPVIGQVNSISCVVSTACWQSLD